jgi:hypothetical protein
VPNFSRQETREWWGTRRASFSTATEKTKTPAAGFSINNQQSNNPYSLMTASMVE